MYKCLSLADKITYRKRLEERLLEHRYRYYVLGEAVISDLEYEYIESIHRKISEELGLPSIFENMVDFDFKLPPCQDAKERVESQTDGYSMRLREVKGKI